LLWGIPNNGRMPAKLVRDLSATAIVALACAVALSACGSSSKKPTADRGGNALIAFSKCMRNHGVTGFPDPIITATPPEINPGEYSTAEYGNGMFIGIPSSINVSSPAFEAAAKTCNFH